MESLSNRLRALEERVAALEAGAAQAPGTMPPEVEAAVSIRFAGDIAAAQLTRTHAQTMLRMGHSAEAVKAAILAEGVVID